MRVSIPERDYRLLQQSWGLVMLASKIVSIPERDYRLLQLIASCGDLCFKSFQSLKGIIGYCNKLEYHLDVAILSFNP